MIFSAVFGQNFGFFHQVVKKKSHKRVFHTFVELSTKCGCSGSKNKFFSLKMGAKIDDFALFYRKGRVGEGVFDRSFSFFFQIDEKVITESRNIYLFLVSQQR